MLRILKSSPSIVKPLIKVGPKMSKIKPQNNKAKPAKKPAALPSSWAMALGSLSVSYWIEALRQFQYKCKWHDRILGAIDRWFPSSKRCNSCGHILNKLPLDVREWTCPSCNNLNLRDKNAALNILAVGQTVFACGSGTGGETTDLLSLAIQGWIKNPRCFSEGSVNPLSRSFSPVNKPWPKGIVWGFKAFKLLLQGYLWLVDPFLRQSIARSSIFRRSSTQKDRRE